MCCPFSRTSCTAAWQRRSRARRRGAAHCHAHCRPRRARRRLARAGPGRPAGRVRGAPGIWQAAPATHATRARRATAHVDRGVTVPSALDADIEAVLVTADEIAQKTTELAKTIDADYADREPLLVGVLKGAVMFMSDLARALSRPSAMEFMAVSSYGSAAKS